MLQDVGTVRFESILLKGYLFITLQLHCFVELLCFASFYSHIDHYFFSFSFRRIPNGSTKAIYNKNLRGRKIYFAVHKVFLVSCNLLSSGFFVASLRS